MDKKIRVAVYARVSTTEQAIENQTMELRRYVEARGWEIFREYCDAGHSGAKESRPALNQMMRDAKARRFSAIVVVRLDRISRSVRHLVFLLAELQELGVIFVSVNESIDLGSVSGRFQASILSAVAEMERGLISERVKAGLSRARAQGKTLGRPKLDTTDAQLKAVNHLSLRLAAEKLRVSRSHVARWRRLHNVAA